MAGRKPGESANQAVAWLATTFVISAGVICMCVIILLFSDSPKKILAYSAGGLCLFLFLLWLLRDRKKEGLLEHRYGGFAGWGRNKKKKVKVRIKRASRDAALDEYPNGPPTAERVRDIIDSKNTWVPSSKHKHARDDELNS